jgi:hypothetical protein
MDCDSFKWTGTEHRPIMWQRKSIDGYYQDDQNNNIAIEFLGDYYHGHPNYWTDNVEAMGPYGKLHKDLFLDTEKKMIKLTSLGYYVYYVWESEYNSLKPSQNASSILKKFITKLY